MAKSCGSRAVWVGQYPKNSGRWFECCGVGKGKKKRLVCKRGDPKKWNSARRAANKRRNARAAADRAAIEEVRQTEVYGIDLGGVSRRRRRSRR